MGWNNLIVGSNELHSVSKSCVNVVNYIANFVKPTPPTKIITNEIILIQYSINQWLGVLRKKIKDELQKELLQFHDIRVFGPKNTQDLSYEHQKMSLVYLVFLELKSDEVKIKGRGFADGKKQRDWLSK